MAYTYDYPHPAVATDIAVFTLRAGALHVLLVRRGLDPFQGEWALPGGFVRPDEDLDTCARRELQEETGVGAADVVQFANFSTPGRDPRAWVISVAYLALLPSEGLRISGQSDADEARWWDLGRLPPLAFDHALILERALAALRERVRKLEILFPLLPPRFTLSQLQAAYEAVMGAAAEKRNFRKMVLASGLLAETEAFLVGVHRPARLYERRR